MKKFLAALVSAALLLGLTACGGTATEGGESAAGGGFQNAVLDENGDIVIQEADITEEAAYINYDAEGVTVQFLAIRAGDDVRLAYNTCQSCSPSPRAYFVQNGDKLVCQNCGQTFAAENVGQGGYGCNPAAVPDAVRSDGTITIPAASALAAASRFANWQGPTA